MDDGGKADARNVYSPIILNDPYVLRRHREVVEALEMECLNFRTHCAEAEQARRWMRERDTSD